MSTTAGAHTRQPGDLASAADLALGLQRWLCDGGLAHPDGGFAAWRDCDSGELAYPYPEITGYFLTFASDVGEACGPIARQAAHWLLQRHRQGDPESRPTEPRVRYAFDTFVEATGLLNFAAATGDEASREAGQQLVGVEIRNILARRDVQPLLPGSRLPERSPTWSTRGRLHLLKAVQALCLFSEHTGLTSGLDAAEILVRRYAAEVRIQSPHFADDQGQHHLHPFCYALEADPPKVPSEDSAMRQPPSA